MICDDVQHPLAVSATPTIGQGKGTKRTQARKAVKKSMEGFSPETRHALSFLRGRVGPVGAGKGLIPNRRKEFMDQERQPR